MFNSLKQLLKRDNERIIIVEDGQPSFVILPFEEYQHLRALEKPSTIDITRDITSREPNPSKRIDRVGLTQVNQGIAPGEKGQEDYGLNFEQELEDNSSGVKIEDLPF